MIRAYAFTAVALVCSFAQADQWAAYRSVVQLNLQEGRQAWQGSGVLVARSGDTGLILSCRHVNTKVGLKVKVTWHGAPGSGWPSGSITTVGKVVYSHKGDDLPTDLALVQAPIPPGVDAIPVVPFDSANGPWRSVGYRDNKLLVSEASGVEPGEDGLVVFNAPYLQGMSGGAVFDRYGRVVAVIVASDFKKIGIAVDGHRLHQMLSLFRR